MKSLIPLFFCLVLASSLVLLSSVDGSFETVTISTSEYNAAFDLGTLDYGAYKTLTTANVTSYNVTISGVMTINTTLTYPIYGCVISNTSDLSLDTNDACIRVHFHWTGSAHRLTIFYNNGSVVDEQLFYAQAYTLPIYINVTGTTINVTDAASLNYEVSDFAGGRPRYLLYKTKTVTSPPTNVVLSGTQSVTIYYDAETPPPPQAIMTKSELIDAFQDLCDTYDDYCSYEIIGETELGADIWAFHIGYGQTRILYTATVHGNENRNADALYYMAEWILTNDSQDAEDIISRLNITIIPAVNYDRYDTHRKNTNEVDLNRNFEYNWGGSGSSSNPADYNYRGEYALSESESYYVRTYMDSIEFDVCVDWHYYDTALYRPSWNSSTPYTTFRTNASAWATEYGVTIPSLSSSTSPGMLFGDANNPPNSALSMLYETSVATEEPDIDAVYNRIRWEMLSMTLAAQDLYGVAGQQQQGGGVTSGSLTFLEFGLGMVFLSIVISAIVFIRKVLGG